MILRFPLDFVLFCFLFAGKILLILLAFHLLCCFLHLFHLLHLLCARRHVVNASPISQLPSGCFGAFFFLSSICLCEKSCIVFAGRVLFGGVCVFFAAAAAVVVVFKED